MRWGQKQARVGNGQKKMPSALPLPLKVTSHTTRHSRIPGGTWMVCAWTCSWFLYGHVSQHASGKGRKPAHVLRVQAVCNPRLCSRLVMFAKSTMLKSVNALRICLFGMPGLENLEFLWNFFCGIDPTRLIALDDYLMKWLRPFGGQKAQNL